MKKLITRIPVAFNITRSKVTTLLVFLLLIVLQVDAQVDTVKKFIKFTDYGRPTQVKYECTIFSNGDTICKEMGKGSSQGWNDSAKVELTVQEQKLLELVRQLNKIENEITKFIIDNGGQELLNTKQQVIGALAVLSREYGIDLQALLKKVQK